MGTENRPAAKAHPAASLIVLRDSERGLELLYLRRNPNITFQGGYWVFPGGRIDPSDFLSNTPADEEPAARRAAVREAHEEAGLSVELHTLRPVCHWTTPETSPKRFATWFFAALAGSEEVRVDGSEILDHRWVTPSAALAAQRASEMRMAAPTFALTTRLAPFDSSTAALAAVEQWAHERLVGRIHKVPGGTVAVYWQDVSYEGGDLERQGRRHRVWMLESGWRYERAF